MRLLLVNGNRTQAVTDVALAEARRCAADGTEVVGVNADFGANIVSTPADNTIAAHAVETDAQSVVLCGAALAGTARRLQHALPVPLIDGVACAVRMAEMLARSAYPRARPAHPANPEMKGITAELAQRYRDI